MKVNDLGLKLIKNFEGCSYKAYLLKGERYYTIGYGHSFDNSITKDTVWNQKQCDDALRKDLARFEAYVTKYACSKFKLNENQFSALVSYTYNRGVGGLQQLLRNSTSIQQLSNNIVVYWGSAVKYKAGLVRRRKAEKVLFDTPVTGVANKAVNSNKDLEQAVSKIIKSGVAINYNQWKREDLINLAYVPALLNKLGGIEQLVSKGIISDKVIWSNNKYTKGNVVSLLLKYANTIK